MEGHYQSKNSYFWVVGLQIIFFFFRFCFVFHVLGNEHVVLLYLEKQNYFPQISLLQDVNCSIIYNIIWNNLNVQQ